MNCAELIGNMGYQCVPLGNAGWCVHTPFPYADDGELVRLFVRDLPHGRVRIYDGGDAVMHAEVHGVRLSSPRLERLRKMLRAPIALDDRDEIGATCAIEEVPSVMPMVLDAVLAVSHMESLWKSRESRSPFISRIENALRPLAGDRLERNARLYGLSGHQIEFPLMISREKRARYIDAVSWNGEHLDWTSAYRVFGKMMDVDWEGMGKLSHVVIVDDAENDPQSQQVITFLARCAPVLRFSESNAWIKDLVA